MSDGEDFARETLLEHSRYPRNRHVPNKTTHKAVVNHEAKADKIEVYLRLSDDTIREIGFQGEGSAVAIASASLMTETVCNMSAAAALKLQKEIRDMLKDPHSDFTPENIHPELVALCGIRKFPARVACASLATKLLPGRCPGTLVKVEVFESQAWSKAHQTGYRS